MCRLYGKLDDVTERNSLVLEKGGKSMRKEKKKMSIKRRIAAAALAAFVGVSSLNVSIPGFSTVITDADETEIASQLSEETPETTEEETTVESTIAAALAEEAPAPVAPAAEEPTPEPIVVEAPTPEPTVVEAPTPEPTVAEEPTTPEPTVVEAPTVEEPTIEEAETTDEEETILSVEETEETEAETEKETEEETEPETDEDDLLSNDPVTFGLRGANGLMLTAGGAIPRLDDYITDVTVSKRRGDSWVKVNEITSGHNVRIDLKYTLPEGLITSQSRKIQYQLPDVIKIDNPPLTGALKDSSEQPVGTFSIDANGLVTFEYSQEFSEDEKSFSGDFFFECKVGSRKTQEEVIFSFPGKGEVTFTIKPSSLAFDIKTTKTASEVVQHGDGEWYVTYTMTISSKKGTGKDIEVFDYFSDDNVVGSQMKQVILLNSIHIWDNNGNYVENIQFEQYENSGFVTTLPKLEAGQKYTITCVALVNKQLLSTSATTNLKLNKNIFYVRSGKNEHSSYAEAEYRRNVIKKTSEKQEDGSYKYTVTINESQENLKGLTIKDTFKLDDTVIDINDIEGFYVDVQGGSNPGITKENFFSTGYKFENDFNNKIVITYRYYPPANETNAEKKLVNRIEIGPNTWGEVEDTIGIIGYLDKTHDENQVVKKDGYVEVPYLVTVTVNDGIAEGATLTDTLNQDHIQSLLTPVTVNGIEASDYTIQYLGKDGVLVNEFAEGMIGFKVTFKAITPEKAQKINFEYKVKAEFASYPAGTFRYDNVAVFASGSINQTKTDSYTYTKHAFLLKKVSRYSSGYQTSIDEVKESDLTDGKLYYELEIKPAERNLNDTFTVTDKLPEGAVYVEDSFNASPTTLNQMSVSEDGRTLTFTIPKEVYVNEDGSYKHDVLYIHYAIQISNANLSGSQQELVYFTNTATSGEDKASVTVPVLFEEKEIEEDDVIDKKGFQNNSDITYTIVVNKNRLDLIPNVNKITLNDVLKCDVDESKIQDITLVGNIVSVYEYDASKPDGKGVPVSKNFYTYQYNEKTHNISMILPDSEAFVVEYTYRFKFTSNYAGQTITIKNNVELVGSYKKEISTQWKNQSAGGSVAKYNSLIVYKVEKGNEDEKLSGAKFNLYKYNDGSFSLIQNDIEIPVTGCKFVSDKTDEDMMAATDIAVEENVLYYLEEVQAPSGYKIEAGHEKFYFALGTYGKSIKDLKAAVAKAVETADITVDDVHFANTNAIVNIENEIEDGAVRIQKVWLNHDGSEMQASESSISVGLYKTHHRYTDAQPVEVEVSYKGNGMSSPQLAFASTEYYRIGTKLTVTGYLNEGWRKNWGGWDFASTQMTARLYINGDDRGELNIENVYSVTHSEIVSSTLNKISIVFTANTYNSILDGNKPGKVNGTIAALAAGDMEFVQNVTIDSHNNWTAVVSDLPTKENDGEDIYYYVTEFSLYGYTISYQNNGVLAGVGGNPIVVINKADEKVKTASFSINKVDASTATPQPLEGASFALYRAVKNDQNQLIRVGLPIATAISNASGTGVVFSGLIPGEYLLYETSAPTGYVTPSEPWRITVNNDCVVDAHGLQTNSDGAYIIENGKYPGILSITKKVEGYEMEEGMHYYIKVTLTDAANKPLTGSFNGIRLENGSAIYELVKDATITFTGLPLGTKYTVEEVNFDGTALTGEEEYTSSLSTNATGTIDKEAGTVAVNVTVTNIYEIPETSAVISVKKIVDGTGYNQNEAFEFTLSAAEEGTPMPTETGNKVSIKAGEIGSFGSITYTDTGVYYYTVKETKGSTVGMSYDETEYLVTVVVSMNDERKLTASVYYNIVMTDIPEVESDVRALVVTNTYRVTSVSGTKTWRVPEGTDLPESITVILKRNDEPVARKKVTAADDWSYEFTELPMYDDDGAAYTYEVDEEPVEGYNKEVDGYDLINTITGTTSVSGSKNWRVPEGTDLPESITVILKRNDEPVARKKVTAANDWSYEFTELPMYDDDGAAYTYEVDEEPVEGYNKEVDGYDLINTITGTTSVSGSKNWRVPEGTDLPESITVILKRNDEPVARKKVTAADDWSYEFTELPAYSEDGSTAYTYTVDEESVEGYITTVSGTNLINTITGTTSVSGTKTWRAPEGTELPESITVILKRNDEPVARKKVTAADDWSYEFTELPMYDEDGVAYTYEVDEEPVEGYNKEVDGYDLINTITGTTSVSGTKTWRVPEGTDLPESITVILKRNDEPVARKKVTAADDWSYEFTELPMYDDDGAAYTYEVDEEPVAGYNKEVDGYDLINTKSEKIEITGTKTWRVPDGTELPESITVILKRNDEPVARKKVTAADDWSYEFTELPAYSEDGRTAYTYTVDEESVEGYITTTVSGSNLINTITGTTSVSGTKTWRAPEGTELPESITVILKRNDEPVARKKVTAADDWSYEFTELPAYSEDGRTAYTYTVDEEPVAGYNKEVDGYDLINTKSEKIEITGTKTWRVPDGTELPESITVILKRNDEPVARKKVTAADDWSYEFTELPAYSEDGLTAYTYTVDEEPVEGYITTVSGTNLINTITGTTSVSGTKTWRAPEGTELPESITVILNRNGSPVDSKKVTATDDWSYEFTNLPAYSEDGRTAYTYTVDEESVEGYITTVSGTNLINTITGTTSVSGTKTWRAPEGTELPESITVILNRNDEPVARKKVTAADDWSYEFTELPAYSEDGSTAYTYTVDEEPVEGYITAVSGTNLINTITGTTSVSGTKTWRVPEGTELPESITVILNRNDEPVARKKVTAADDWSYEFTELPAYSEDGSTAYTYTVDEEPVEGYITAVSGTNLINTITGTTSVSGTKTWRAPEGTKLPESITVILNRNGSPVDSKKVTATDDWSYEFTNLPAYSEDGLTAYTYTVDEESVAGYNKEVDGYDLINTKSEKIEITGTKTWRAPEGTELPESITVILKRNDEPVARKKVTAADDWSYEFTELPAYSEDGLTAYTYTVDEEPVEGYITTVSGTDLINTITSVKISKVDIANGEELEGATIQLIDKETGEVVEEWTSTNKAHEVTGLTTGKTYILRETVAPEGYSITSDTTFELKEDGSIDTEKTTTTVSEEGVLLVEDTRRIDFIINKVSATDDHELYDTILSVYEITDEGEVLVDSWTSRWKEVHNFGLKLSCGKSYILREDKATGGYHKIPGDILFNVTADGKIQITEGQDWKYENGKNVIEEVVDEAGNVIYLIRDVRNPEEEEETEPDGPTDPHQSETTTPEETTTSEEETTPEETTTSEEETSPEETTVSEEETTVSEEETTLPSPDDEGSTPEVTTPAANTTTTAAETTVSETPTTTLSSERVILGIEDMSRTIGMALAGFGAIMLTALIWLYLRSKKA